MSDCLRSAAQSVQLFCALVSLLKAPAPDNSCSHLLLLLAPALPTPCSLCCVLLGSKHEHWHKAERGLSSSWALTYGYFSLHLSCLFLLCTTRALALISQHIGWDKTGSPTAPGCGFSKPAPNERYLFLTLV